jgi:hypothetical protein
LGGGVFPGLNLAFRYGISDKTDLGARLGSNGLEFQSKFQFTEDDGVVISLAPSLSTWFIAIAGVGAGFVTVPVPLLIDIPVGESALVLGPRVRPTLAFASGAGVGGGGFGLGVGTSVGFAAKVSDGLRVFPELGMEVPVLNTTTVSTTTTNSDGTTTTTSTGAGGGFAGIGFDFHVNLLIGKTK